jgi:RecB family endonuclease NucS
LTIRIHRVISDTTHDLDENDEGLVRDGTEGHLQEWLAENPEALGEGYTLVAREAQAGGGRVDLLVKDAEGVHVAVEVKRVAMVSAVKQVRGYVEDLNEKGEYGVVRGMIAALDIRPSTVKEADKKGVSYVTVDAAWNGRDGVVSAIPITKHVEAEMQQEDELFAELQTGT